MNLSFSKILVFVQKAFSRKSDLVDTSFLVVTRVSETLVCKWKLREASKVMIKSDFDSVLLIRVRDVSNSMTSSKIIKASLAQTEARIHLPVEHGRILVDLGYRCGSEFITLEYQLIDLGSKIVQKPRYVDWFTQESANIHEEMYNLAFSGKKLGGSEIFQKPY